MSKSLGQVLDDLMWPSVTISAETPMSTRHEIYEWCASTFGLANFVVEKNRIYFRQAEYITLFRIRFP